MKKLFSNPTVNVTEVANQIIYSMKVLMIGLFIPFSFLFGISYNRHSESAKSEISRNKTEVVPGNNTTVDLGKVLPDQNS